MSKRGFSTILCAAGLALVFGCSDDAEQADSTSRQDTVRVSVTPVNARTFKEYGEYYGKLEGIRSATIVCYAGGRVKALHAKEGQYVKEGSHLAEVDAERIVAQYETAKLNEKVARDTYEQAKRQHEAGNVAKVRVDQAKLQWLQSKSQLAEARRARRGALCITPLSGIVTLRNVELYQEVQPGTPAFKVVQTSVMKVKIGIPESEYAGVKEGNGAKVTVSVYPERSWEGKLRSLAREISPQSRSYPAEIHIRNRDRILDPGLTAKVRLLLRTHSDAVVVPTSAILNEGKTNYVMVTHNPGTASKRIVQTGPSSTAETVIRGGLKPGERLIVEGHQLVRENTPIQVVK